MAYDDPFIPSSRKSSHWTEIGKMLLLCVLFQWGLLHALTFSCLIPAFIPSFCSLCKQLIQQIIDRGNQPHMDGMGGGGGGGGGGGPEGNSVLEMSIPGTKVGLIIGKGGETIRQLQVSLCPLCGLSSAL